MKLTIPDAVLAQHTAVLGKTGSGKTSTTKLAVEQVVAEDFRVCILDSIKSDWWGITSSGDGKKPGLPFKILGGPHGHVPLHSSAGKVIGQLVGAGKLPLSIIDMADFEAGGLQRFFIDFAQSLMRSMRGVVYLVIEEAHEFAPKERAGIGAENLAIHWAKKLATAGRSKGIRLIVATQRVQALHNAVLGSCETVIAHRLTTPADQEPVIKWLKANASKEKVAEVESSLSSLPTGTGWICSGEAHIFEKVAFPKFKTYDNTATPTGDGGEVEIKTASVDQDELRSIIGDAVKEAEANDVPTLRKRIAELEAAAKKAPAPKTVERLVEKVVADPRAIAQAEKRAMWVGSTTGAVEAYGEALRLLDKLPIVQAIAKITQTMDRSKETRGKAIEANRASQAVEPPTNPVATPAPQTQRASAPSPKVPASSGDGALSGPQRQLLRALAWWKAMGHDRPSRPQVAGIAGWKITSGHLKNIVGSLKTAGLVNYPDAGHIELTDAGAAAAPDPDMSVTLVDGIRSVLSNPQKQIFDTLLADAAPLAREAIAAACGWEPTSGHLKNIIGSLRTLEVVEYPTSGQVALQEWVRG